ncbi:GNAT family N-acetyltransferase [Litoreibacter roseus]|uniref:N-acetyltransferase GCN5 n=1 Tax=Litoreibacter roseus TaxID=2601869 RepID=A0A6N6JBX1_9RHOB|nr:GNAT family N-acetyltransferase [Litoreibacter roseus]GFE63791.1 N-acetyltransferase GCN5 [Litoreibacter roseus]
MIRHRVMTLDDLEVVLSWAAAEGWNPGLDDASAFLAADPNGFFVAEEGATPVAAISVVNHSDTFSFLGLYLCQPAYRGKGIGLALWRHAIAHAGNRTIGLDGVPEQQSNYAKFGFDMVGKTIRYSGVIDPAASPEIRDATAEDIAGLVKREAIASGWSKPRYLSEWFQTAPSRKTLVFGQGSQVSGFATVRKCRSGAKIGPLVAPDKNIAEALIRDAARIFEGPISIDVPWTSEGLSDQCRFLGLEPVFETGRMYRGKSATPSGSYVAVTTLELG